jgi:hypothetical protein
MRYTERLTITGVGSNISLSLETPIRFDYNKKYEVCLLSLNMYNDIPNVTNKNNKFKYTNNISGLEDGASDSSRPFGNIVWKTIELPPGTYQFEEINNKITEEMIKNDDYDKEKNEFYINISVNAPEQKSIISINNSRYGVMFDEDNSLCTILGFQPVSVLRGDDNKISYKSPNIVNITATNIVLVHTNFVSGSYNNSKKTPMIYAFDPNIVNPGWKIFIQPRHLEYYLITPPSIDDINIWLTDEDGNLLDINNTEVSVRLEIREII